MWSTRHHRRELFALIEVRQQTAQVALIGAIAVHEQQEPNSGGTLDDVGDECHKRAR